MKSEIRYCRDLGMFALDRPMKTCTKTCTSFCRKNCFNWKFYLMYKKDMLTKDQRNEIFWQELDGQKLNEILKRKRKDISRFRLCTRGEPITCLSDIEKIKGFALYNPNTDFWIPTRSWRDPELRKLAVKILFPIPNIKIQASIDPSNTIAEVASLDRQGWKTMFFGDNSFHPLSSKAFKCLKTWGHNKAVCLNCDKGCFNKKQSHVWLKQH